MTATLTTNAVVVRELGTCAVEELGLVPPGPTDVVVHVEASGICHSDVSVLTGDLPSALPAVLGHEAVGVVIDTGADVTSMSPGDRVVLSAMPSCGACWFCVRGETFRCLRLPELRRDLFTDGDRRVRGAAGLGTFTELLVVPEVAAVPVHTDLPAEQLAILGCAVMTGTGAALNIAPIDVGESVVVIGAGGVGLGAVQGARLRGACPLVAVDPQEASRSLAIACGATHAVDPEQVDVVDYVRQVTGGLGAGVVIDCVASPVTFASAWGSARSGATIVVPGVPSRDVLVNIPLVDLVLSGRKIAGCQWGNSVARRDFPRYVALAEAGRLDLGVLLGRRIVLADVPDALSGPPPVGRTVVLPRGRP